MDKTPFLLIITPLSIIVSIIKTEMYSDKLGQIRTGEGFKCLIKKKISDILGRTETWNWLRGQEFGIPFLRGFIFLAIIFGAHFGHRRKKRVF